MFRWAPWSGRPRRRVGERRGPGVSLCAADAAAGAAGAGRPDAVQRQQLLRVRGRSVAWLPPLVLLVAIAVLDWNTTGEFRIISWIVLVPGHRRRDLRGVGARRCSPRSRCSRTSLGDNSWPHQYRTGLPDFVLVAVGGVLAVARLRGPACAASSGCCTCGTSPRPPAVPCCARCRRAGAASTTRPSISPPTAEARVGGDFYDIQPGPHGTRRPPRRRPGQGARRGGGGGRAARHVPRGRRTTSPTSATVADRLEVRMAAARPLPRGRRPGRRRPLRHGRPLGFPAGAERGFPGDGVSGHGAARTSRSSTSGTSRRSWSPPTGYGPCRPATDSRSGSASSSRGGDSRRRSGCRSLPVRPCCWSRTG